MKNVLVTGGAGFIGSNFVRYLLGAEPEVQVINLDALTYAGSLENLRELPAPERHHFVRGNICDAALVDNLFTQYKIDTVIHFAAETHVDRSIVYPDHFVQANIVGTFTLLETARKVWIREKRLIDEQVHFHHVSTDEVFGTLSPTDPAFNEVTPYNPRSPYAATKAASDHLVRAYFHTYGLPITITNCSNNYGPYQFPEKLIPLMILNAASGRPLPVYGDGRQVRDWLYVGDHCEAIHLVVRKGRLGETYAIGGDNQPANIEIVQLICSILDELLPESPHRPHASLIQHVADRPGHDRRYDMDIRKIREELGWRPRQSIATGLRETVQWYLSHPGWVEKVYHHPDFQKWVNKNYADRSILGKETKP